MLKSEVYQRLQNILADAGVIQNLLENEDDEIECSTVLLELYEAFDDIATMSTGAMNDLNLGSDIDMCMTELNRW